MDVDANRAKGLGKLPQKTAQRYSLRASGPSAVGETWSEG
jgi:hypothetical protein